MLFFSSSSVFPVYWWSSYKLDPVFKEEFAFVTHDIVQLKDSLVLMILKQYPDTVVSTYILNLKNKQFEKINTKSSPPRVKDLGNISDGKVLWFGAATFEDGPETWIFDIDSLNWNQIQTKHLPHFGDSVNLAHLAENKVLMTGGYWEDVGDTRWNRMETWIFDYDKMDWQKVETTKNPRPHYQWNISFIEENKVLCLEWILYQFNDSKTWLFDYKKMDWEEIVSQIKPSDRSQSEMAMIDTGRVVMFGGSYFKDDTTYIFDNKTMGWNKIFLQPHPIDRSDDYKISTISKNAVVIPADSTLWVLYFDSTITEIDTTGPHVVETIPEDLEENVSVDSEIIIKFEKPIKPQSLSWKNFLIDGSYYSQEYYTLTDDFIIHLNPPGLLDYNRVYKIKIFSDIEDIFNYKMSEDYSFSFKTEKLIDIDDDNQSTGRIEPVLVEQDGTNIKVIIFAGEAKHNQTYLKLYNILGQEIHINLISPNSFDKMIYSLDINKINSGFYLLVIFNNEKVVTKKLTL